MMVGAYQLLQQQFRTNLIECYTNYREVLLDRKSWKKETNGIFAVQLKKEMPFGVKGQVYGVTRVKCYFPECGIEVRDGIWFHINTCAELAEWFEVYRYEDYKIGKKRIGMMERPALILLKNKRKAVKSNSKRKQKPVKKDTKNFFQSWDKVIKAIKI